MISKSEERSKLGNVWRRLYQHWCGFTLSENISSFDCFLFLRHISRNVMDIMRHVLVFRGANTKVRESKLSPMTVARWLNLTRRNRVLRYLLPSSLSTRSFFCFDKSQGAYLFSPSLRCGLRQRELSPVRVFDWAVQYTA